MASIRLRLDRLGIFLSGLCAVHCLLSIVLVSVLGLGGQLLLAPEIHEFGLALAIVIGAGTLGIAAWRHQRRGPLLLGGAGIGLMAMALTVDHGPREAALTIAGVLLLGLAHMWNLRGAT